MVRMRVRDCYSMVYMTSEIPFYNLYPCYITNRKCLATSRTCRRQTLCYVSRTTSGQQVPVLFTVHISGAYIFKLFRQNIVIKNYTSLPILYSEITPAEISSRRVMTSYGCQDLREWWCWNVIS